MKKAFIFVSIASVSLGAGALLAMRAGPGGWGPRAFAELYHGSVDTSGTVHVAVDCDTTTPGTQADCFYWPGTNIDVAVSAGNSTGADTLISAFNFKVRNSNQPLLEPATGVDADLDGNPDFNDAIAPAGWACTPPPPAHDEDPNPALSLSSLACNETALPANAISLPDGETRDLATVRYTNQFGMGGSSSLTLELVAIFDDSLTELMSCNPEISVFGHCFGATVHVIPQPTWPATPTMTSTPSPTATPDPGADTDGDGVPNATDNCPLDANPGQENNDRNFIDNSPPYSSGADDVTRAHSDNQGDACDADDDNDGRSDLDEVSGAGCPIATTVPLLSDTDGDRALDGAECILGTNPASSASAPLLTDCGPVAIDIDGDRVQDRIEWCYYNTAAPPNTVAPDWDGDGVRDGCEIASLNGDLIVNSGDQGMLAARIAGAVAYHPNVDLNKDGLTNSGDQGFMAQFIATSGLCP